jgi:A/G-specific adenine glycosylase
MLRMPSPSIISCPEDGVNGEAADFVGSSNSNTASFADRFARCGRMRTPALSPVEKKSNIQLSERTFRARLLAWYDAHARDLPWRKNRDPYRVWVSEIMLQQTRVTAVIEHYHEFLKRFPRVEKLGSAREASVLAAWSGLGYYRRARMLHAAAKVVVREMGGQCPVTAEAWRQLPGIGRYTAAAIGSIAFGEAVAVVDGNVERVLQRATGKRITGEELWRQADRLLDHERPGDFNQAIMELGATVCTPRAPACLMCPVVELCATRGELAVSPKTAKQKKLEIHYALDFRDRGGRNSRVFLVQRPYDSTLMGGMWELPEIETAVARTGKKQIPPLRTAQGRNDKTNGGAKDNASNGTQELLFTVRHSITVTDYTVHVWRRTAPAGASGAWVAADRLKRVALTGLARKALRKAGVL